MILENYLSKRMLSETTIELIDKLKLYWDNDEEFILGVLVDLETDEERKQVINFIDNGVDVSYEQITLLSLWINNNRGK